MGITADAFHAPSKHPLSTEQVEAHALRIATEMHGAHDSPEKIDFANICALVSSSIERICSGRSDIHSMNTWTGLCRERFNKEEFARDHPSEASYVDGFCLRLRAEIALSMYPEKLLELVQIIQSSDEKVWNSTIMQRNGRVSLRSWFANNVRTADGKVDWQRVHDRMNLSSEYSLEHSEHRSPFTKESALSGARETLDGIIEKMNHWHPNDLLDADKSLYSFLTGLAEFRRAANRPDIQHRDNTRPNWVAIAEALGPNYQERMVIGHNGNEQQLREFSDAIDQLEDMLDAHRPTVWNASWISTTDRALYHWFQNHCRQANGSIDYQRILQALDGDWSSKFTFGGSSE